MLKKLVMLLSLCCSSISLFSISSETLKVNAENQKESIVAPETYYTTLNGYNYDLAANFNDSVDSFEAWVKLPVASIGGTIVGNFCEPSYPYNTVNWKVNAAGHFGFDWNDKAISYTFDDTKNIADNTVLFCYKVVCINKVLAQLFCKSLTYCGFTASRHTDKNNILLFFIYFRKDFIGKLFCIKAFAKENTAG